MKKWITEKTTIAGLIGILLAGLQAYTMEPNLLTAIIAALSAALMIFREKTPPAAMLMLLLGGCASMQKPTEQQIEQGVIIGCIALDAAGCFDDVQDVFPGLNAYSCPDRIKYLIDLTESGTDGADAALVAISKIDLQKFDPTQLQSLYGATCTRAKEVLGVR